MDLDDSQSVGLFLHRFINDNTKNTRTSFVDFSSHAPTVFNLSDDSG